MLEWKLFHSQIGAQKHLVHHVWRRAAVTADTAVEACSPTINRAVNRAAFTLLYGRAESWLLFPDVARRQCDDNR